jgi:hypothetical protein
MGQADLNRRKQRTHRKNSLLTLLPPVDIFGSCVCPQAFHGTRGFEQELAEDTEKELSADSAASC